MESSLFFARLKLELGAGGYKQNPPSVRYLKKAEALKARRLIMGLIVIDKERIDLSGMDHEEMVRKVEEVGSFSNTSGDRVNH